MERLRIWQFELGHVHSWNAIDGIATVQEEKTEGTKRGETNFAKPMSPGDTQLGNSSSLDFQGLQSLTKVSRAQWDGSPHISADEMSDRDWSPTREYSMGIFLPKRGVQNLQLKAFASNLVSNKCECGVEEDGTLVLEPKRRYKNRDRWSEQWYLIGLALPSCCKKSIFKLTGCLGWVWIALQTNSMIGSWSSLSSVASIRTS